MSHTSLLVNVNAPRRMQPHGIQKTDWSHYAEFFSLSFQRNAKEIIKRGIEIIARSGGTVPFPRWNYLFAACVTFFRTCVFLLLDKEGSEKDKKR